MLRQPRSKLLPASPWWNHRDCDRFFCSVRKNPTVALTVPVTRSRDGSQCGVITVTSLSGITPSLIPPEELQPPQGRPPRTLHHDNQRSSSHHDGAPAGTTRERLCQSCRRPLLLALRNPSLEKRLIWRKRVERGARKDPPGHSSPLRHCQHSPSSIRASRGCPRRSDLVSSLSSNGNQSHY
jgi:hypothetical protein